MNLEEEISQELSSEMASAMDFEILSDILVKNGWHKIVLDTLKNRYHSIDVTSWCESNCKNSWHYRGRTFIFKDQKDAVMFGLKWHWR